MRFFIVYRKKRSMIIHMAVCEERCQEIDPGTGPPSDKSFRHVWLSSTPLHKDKDYFSYQSPFKGGKFPWVNSLWNQLDDPNPEPVEDGFFLNLSGQEIGNSAAMLEVHWLSEMRGLKLKNMYDGFSIDMCLKFTAFQKGGMLLDVIDETDKGICVCVQANGSLSFRVSDGYMSAYWVSDYGALKTNSPHRVVINIDGGPRVISYMTHGIFCEGGSRPFGWGKFQHRFRDPNGSSDFRISQSGNVTSDSLKIYNRCLKTSGAIANYVANA